MRFRSAERLLNSSERPGPGAGQLAIGHAACLSGEGGQGRASRNASSRAATNRPNRAAPPSRQNQFQLGAIAGLAKPQAPCHDKPVQGLRCATAASKLRPQKWHLPPATSGRLPRETRVSLLIDHAHSGAVFAVGQHFAPCCPEARPPPRLLPLDVCNDRRMC